MITDSMTEVIGLEIINAMLIAALPPVNMSLDGSLQTWEEPVLGKSYTVAVDPAMMSGDDDFSAMQVIDSAGFQCAEYEGKGTPHALAAIAVNLARTYNEALLVIEVNGIGMTVLNMVIHDHLYKNTFHQKCVQPGWTTTMRSRAMAVRELNNLILLRPEVFKSRRLMEEWLMVDAIDDLTLAMAIAQAVRVGIR